jgi:SAM-dependent methyltransferase
MCGCRYARSYVMTWWENIFGDERVWSLLEGGPSPSMAERQTAFVASVIRVRPGLRVLDIGCGCGWLSAGLARRSAVVTGVDSSPAMAQRCRRLASETTGFTLIKADFAELDFDHQFDAVLCWGNVIGYTTRDADIRLLRCLERALRPGAMILLDLHNSVFYRTHTLGKRWHELQEHYLLEDSSYDQIERRLVIRSILVPKTGENVEEYAYRVLHYEPEEIRAVLQQLGFSDITFYGEAHASKDGPLFSPDGYTEQSHVMIVSGNKA